MAYLIKTDGTIEAVEPRNGKDFQLDEMQAMMGGYIDIVNQLYRQEYPRCQGKNYKDENKRNEFARCHRLAQEMDKCRSIT